MGKNYASLFFLNVPLAFEERALMPWVSKESACGFRINVEYGNLNAGWMVWKYVND